MVIKSVVAIARRYILEVGGRLQAVMPDQDPFIFALNHNQRHEAVMVPALLQYLRAGKPIHFLADWAFMLAPVIGSMYRCGQVILVTNKDAKPKFLNVFKPLFKQEKSAHLRALDTLLGGASVGIFPEGVINRHPKRLMRGLPGAAKLSLASGAPVVPAGLRFPNQDPEQPISDGSPMVLEIGDPLTPPEIESAGSPSRDEVQRFHRRIMEDIARISGKDWSPTANKRSRYVV